YPSLTSQSQKGDAIMRADGFRSLTASSRLVAAIWLAWMGAVCMGDTTVEKVEYKGWKNNLRLTNGQVELVATLDVGPRIIRFGFTGGENAFKEYPDQLGKTGEKDWQNRGGHRLWHAPEAMPRTYFPDNGPVAWKELSEGVVRLTPAPETSVGVQ